jgi:hypothetical protein
MQPAIKVPAKHRKRPRNAIDTESASENEDMLDDPNGPERGQLAEDSKLDETVAPPVGNDADNSATEITMRKPGVANRKVVPARSPLPLRATRPAHPGAPDMAKPKRTSAEVTAAAERKVALQRQEDELEQKKIDKLAEMELDEELAEEVEERTLVRKQAHADSLDDTEDVIMQSEDEEPRISEEIFELSTSEEEAKNAVPIKKRSQVCSSSDAELTNTEIPHQKRKKKPGELKRLWTAQR